MSASLSTFFWLVKTLSEYCTMMHVVIVIHNFQRGGADPPPSTKRMDVITK